MANYRYCIYKHTSKTSRKSYIGCTHLNPLHRWGKDGSNYDSGNVFGQAIRQYGWEDFTHEILEYGIIGMDNAYLKEKKYIKEYNTIVPNGYNSEDGGIDGSTNPSRRDRNKRPKSGWHHSDETKKKMSQSQKIADTHSMQQRINHSKPVDMYSMDGEYIRTYYGANEASRDTNIDVSTICKCCKNPKRYKSCGGYRWAYHKF